MNAALFAALYVSEQWFLGWVDNHESKMKRLRQHALYCKARSVVVYDRTYAVAEKKEKE